MGNYYSSFGGTSAACPYAAGAAACLQSAAEAMTGSLLTPTEVRSKLTNTGDWITDSKVAISAPRVNLAAAVSSLPAIDKLKPRPRDPGQVVRIIGRGFGDTQGNSVVRIGPREFDSTSRRIKLWSETKIKVRIPNYKCGWFKGQDYRLRKVWVTVGGVDSNKKKLKVVKPDTCP
jgi:hypothetical protein